MGQLPATSGDFRYRSLSPSSRHSVWKGHKEVNISVNNHTFDFVTWEKLLGVVMDQNHTWKGHVDKVHMTVGRLLVKFWCIKPFLPTDAHIKYCQALISPPPTLITVAQSGDPPNLKDCTRSRMVFNVPTQTPTKPLLEKLNWMSVMDRVGYKWVIMVHKSINGTSLGTNCQYR